MQRIIALMIGLEIVLTGFSQIDSVLYVPAQTKYRFDWGNNSTEISLTQYGQKKDIVIIHLHDNEFASAQAAEMVLERTGGLLIGIDNKGKRLISFKKSGKTFHFDPNRIFTVHGRLQNLHFLNKQVTKAAVSSVKTFSAFILQKIPNSAKTLIAVHNNKNGDYSINAYKAREIHANEVSKLYINTKRDPDDFFIVTTNEIFEKLRKAGFNVVLQNSARAKDDGSLSVYYGRRKKIVYVNVEAQEGSLQEQITMLKGLVDLSRH